MIKNKWRNEDRCCLAVLSDNNRTVRIPDLMEYPGRIVTEPLVGPNYIIDILRRNIPKIAVFRA
jgi:hypothetical protein